MTVPTPATWRHYWLPMEETSCCQTGDLFEVAFHFLFTAHGTGGDTVVSVGSDHTRIWSVQVQLSSVWAPVFFCSGSITVFLLRPRRRVSPQRPLSS